LAAEDLHKTFGGVVALDGFSLAVAPGEVVGLIGHNGAGKSTFASVVAGLISPDRGRIHVGGVDVARDPRGARARLGLAPQALALYPGATARQNLRVFGGLAGLRRAALARETALVAEALHLTDVLDRPVALLSGGQQRRTQTASALLHRPPVLVLDEPTVGADPITRQAVLGAVRARADEGAAVVYTTHYLPELEPLRATIAVAAAGRVLARGRHAELLEGLPGELRLRFAGPIPEPLLRAAPGAAAAADELRVATPDPPAELARLLALLPPGARVADVDLRRPTLDDLLRTVAVPARA
jgi:ABC-2 type transport system ATP-binding protein